MTLSMNVSMRGCGCRGLSGVVILISISSVCVCYRFADSAVGSASLDDDIRRATFSKVV
jgi:hypothetical protein